MTVSNRAERLNGVTERRSVGLTDFEIRTEGNTLAFQGLPSLFNVGYDMYGGPEKGGWTETVDPKAFDRTLSAKPDVVLNINHGEGGTGLPLARTTSGTLELRTDSKGLVAKASLDLRDPDVQALQVKVERGDLNQMSFAFRTIRQEWNNEETTRLLTELSLDRGDVSIVTNGANDKTSFQLRGIDEAIAMLAAMDPEAAEREIRSMSTEEMAQVQSAHTMLGHLMGCCSGTDDGMGGGSYSWDDVGVEYRDKYNEADRKAMAKTGEAMPDGSYPIKDEQDLTDAIHAVGRGNASHDAIRKHIITRAKALGRSNLIPPDWNSDGSIKAPSRSLEIPRLTLAQAKRLATMDARR